MNVRVGVIGVGGAGNNLVTRMRDHELLGAEFIAVNTDERSLGRTSARHRLLLGEHLTGGRGTGGDLDMGARAAIDAAGQLRPLLAGFDLLFVACGLGGGTGTGAAPVIAQIAREAGALTVALTTRPFAFEGPARHANAEEGLRLLVPQADALIVLDNERLLLRRFGPDAPRVSFRDALEMADRVLFHGVKGLTELLHHDGLINLDFSDVRACLAGAGHVHMGFGAGYGASRLAVAARAAAASPLLARDIDGATRLLVNLIGPPDLTLQEVTTALETLRAATGVAEPDVLFGVRTDGTLHDEARVMVVATQFEAQSSPYTLAARAGVELPAFLRGDG